jgi:DNA-binding CsgD family transcriptional regulator
MLGEAMPRKFLEDNELIELIFDCAESEAGLEPALSYITALLGGNGAHILVLQRRQLVDSHFHGDDGSTYEEYERNWLDKDPRFAAAVAHVGQIYSDVQVIDPKFFEASAIYNDFLSKLNIRYTLFASIAITPDLLLAQAFLRQKRMGAFESGDVDAVRRLLPHLRRALHLRHLVCGNAAAEQLLAVGDGVRLDRQTVTALIPSEAQQMADAISRTTAFAEGTSCRHSQTPGTMALQLTRRRGRPLGLVLMPLRPLSELREHGHRSARVLAVFHDPDTILRLDPGLIAQLHGLTNTEALLASALAQGHSLAQFAAARGCSEQTARTHLKRVLDKTGTRRQSNLVRVLLGSVTLHLARH